MRVPFKSPNGGVVTTLHSCEATTGFTAVTACNVALDNTHFIEGTTAVRVTGTGANTEIKWDIALPAAVDLSNLSHFDFTGMWSANVTTGTLYVSAASNFGTNGNVEISLSNASWNRVVVTKASLGANPNWAAIRYFRIRLYAFVAAAHDVWLDGLKAVMKDGKTITLRDGTGTQLSDLSSGVTYAGEDVGEARTIEGVPCVYCKSDANTVGEIKLALNNMVDLTKTARVSYRMWGVNGGSVGHNLDASFNASGLGTNTAARAAYPAGWKTINIHRSEFSGTLNWHLAKHFRWRVGAGGVGVQREFAVADLRIYPNAKPTVVITHDDEYSTISSFVAPLLATYGWAGVAYVMYDNIGGAGYCTEAQLQALYDAGWDMCNHTMTHTNHAATTYAQALADFSPMKDYLVSKGWTRGNCHLHACYPQGAYNSTTLAALQAIGTLTATTVNDGTEADENFQTSPLTINRYLTADKTLAQFNTRLKLAIARGENLLLYTHGVDAGAAQALYTQQLAAVRRYEQAGYLEVKTLTELMAGI